jgi:hypothetical protein
MEVARENADEKIDKWLLGTGKRKTDGNCLMGKRFIFWVMKICHNHIVVMLTQ